MPHEPVWALAPNTAEMLVSLARDGSPAEVCGLIYANRVICVANVHESPMNAFRMDADEQKRVMIRQRRAPSAVWHSHPSNSFLPSGEDVDSLPDDIPSVIVLPNGRIGVWLNGILQQELEGVGNGSSKHG